MSSRRGKGEGDAIVSRRSKKFVVSLVGEVFAFGGPMPAYIVSGRVLLSLCDQAPLRVLAVISLGLLAIFLGEDVTLQKVF